MFQNISADSETLRKSGDVLLVMMPLSAMGASWYLEDGEGMREFAVSLAVTGVTTETLKSVTHKKRPDGTDNQSFPSAHTAATFATAAYIHRRYGWERSIAPYMLASFVGYSRVASERHYVEDVVAGAMLGTVSSWFLTSENHDLRVTPLYSHGFFGMEFRADF